MLCFLLLWYEKDGGGGELAATSSQLFLLYPLTEGRGMGSVQFIIGCVVLCVMEYYLKNQPAINLISYCHINLISYCHIRVFLLS